MVVADTLYVAPKTIPLSTSHPNLVSRLVNASDAANSSFGSSKPLLWFCDGARSGHPYHEFEMPPGQFRRMEGCPVCTGHHVLVGWNDILTTDPSLAARLVDPSLALQLRAGSNKAVEWWCEGVGDESHPRYQWTGKPNVVRKTQGCPACQGRAVLPGWNDLATTYPQVAKSLVDTDLAQKLRAGSHEKALWFCEESHPYFVWEAPVYRRTLSNAGCPACGGIAVIEGWNDLCTTHPHLASQLVEPEEGKSVSYGSTKKLRWFCSGGSVGHPYFEYDSNVLNKYTGNTSCPACSNRTLIRGWNDLHTVEPDLAAELVNPSDGHEVTIGSTKVLRWFCSGNESGHPYSEWDMSVSVRQSRGRGCPDCVSGSWRRNDPAVCYLLMDFIPSIGAQVLQYGKTQHLNARLKAHRWKGFKSKPLGLVGFSSGKEATEFETAIIHLQKSMSVPTCTDAGYKFDGSSESIIVNIANSDFLAVLAIAFGVEINDVASQ